jgi:hypothetical protein
MLQQPAAATVGGWVSHVCCMKTSGLSAGQGTGITATQAAAAAAILLCLLADVNTHVNFHRFRSCIATGCLHRWCP